MHTPALPPIRKIDIGLLKELLNNENLSSEEKSSVQKQHQDLPEIFRLLASLEDNTQKMLLDNWAKMELILNEKTIDNLLQYLTGNPADTQEDKLSVIKAFAFLEMNNLPYSVVFLNGLRSIFAEKSSLSDSLNNLLQANTAQKDQLLIDDLLLKEIIISNDNSKEALKNFTDKISDFINSYLREDGDKNEIYNNLLGQKLINLDLQENSSPILLALEIPLLINREKTVPVFLKIKAESEAKAEQYQAERIYEAALIIQTANLGTIKSIVKIKAKNISTTFYSSSDLTAQLIRNNFALLKDKLEAQGLTINKPKIEKFAEKEQNERNFFNQLVLSEFKESKTEIRYTPLDIKA